MRLVLWKRKKLQLDLNNNNEIKWFCGKICSMSFSHKLNSSKLLLAKEEMESSISFFSLLSLPFFIGKITLNILCICIYILIFFYLVGQTFEIELSVVARFLLQTAVLTKIIIFSSISISFALTAPPHHPTFSSNILDSFLWEQRGNEWAQKVSERQQLVRADFETLREEEIRSNYYFRFFLSFSFHFLSSILYPLSSWIGRQSNNVSIESSRASRTTTRFPQYQQQQLE